MWQTYSSSGCWRTSSLIGSSRTIGRRSKVNLRHPAAWVHFGCHLACMLIVWPWYGAVAVAVTHALIDTRVPLIWWRTLIGQKQVDMARIRSAFTPPVEERRGTLLQFKFGTFRNEMPEELANGIGWNVAAMQVAFWQDQAAHVLVLGVVSWLVSSSM